MAHIYRGEKNTPKSKTPKQLAMKIKKLPLKSPTISGGELKLATKFRSLQNGI